MLLSEAKRFFNTLRNEVVFIPKINCEEENIVLCKTRSGDTAQKSNIYCFALITKS